MTSSVERQSNQPVCVDSRAANDQCSTGATIRLLAQKEVDAFRIATKYQEVQAAWVKEQEGKGIKDAAAVLKKVSAILK